MKLILHIGSHKTASTSIQHFCVLNRELLKSYGYFYPKNKDSAYVFNFLAAQLAHGKGDQTARFLQKVRAEAEKEKCHTVIISAESFYAMTWFFLDVQGKPRADDYWQNETGLIKELFNFCDGFDEISIACYLRPQDEFAASLYNQFVKNVFGISEAFEEFIETAKPIFDYERHIQLWGNVFGADSISIRNFSTCKENITKDFCESFLTADCFHEAKKKDFMANLRLSRDVLEFKRIFNRIKPDRSLAFIALCCFMEIDKEFKDKPGYQVFAPNEFRKTYFSSYMEGNDKLAERYNLGEFPAMGNELEPTYPGLSLEKATEVYLRLRFQLDLPKKKWELVLRRLANLLMNRLPGGRWLLAPIRTLNNQLRLRFSGW
jgi:hypothetical protein